MKSILDPEFKYVPAVKTDIRRTFARVRAQLRQEEAERVAKVTPLKKVAKSS